MHDIATIQKCPKWPFLIGDCLQTNFVEKWTLKSAVKQNLHSLFVFFLYIAKLCLRSVFAYILVLEILHRTNYFCAVLCYVKETHFIIAGYITGGF